MSAGEIAQRMRGRSPDDDALAFARHWDALTRRTVLERAANVPEVRFFTDEEAATLRAFCDVVTGQDSEPRIPVLEMIDERLVDAGPDGFRHHDMPTAPETWRRIAANLDASARDAGKVNNAQLRDRESIAILPLTCLFVNRPSPGAGVASG